MTSHNVNTSDYPPQHAVSADVIRQQTAQIRALHTRYTAAKERLEVAMAAPDTEVNPGAIAEFDAIATEMLEIAAQMRALTRNLNHECEQRTAHTAARGVP